MHPNVGRPRGTSTILNGSLAQEREFSQSDGPGESGDGNWQELRDYYETIAAAWPDRPTIFQGIEPKSWRHLAPYTTLQRVVPPYRFYGEGQSSDVGLWIV